VGKGKRGKERKEVFSNGSNMDKSNNPKRPRAI
jgi:hypothetical protein